MSITITPEIQATREAVLASLQREDLHDQSTWNRENVAFYQDAGLVDDEKIDRALNGERVEICGTVGCVAGHALLDRAESVALVRNPEYEDFVELHWTVDGKEYAKVSEAAKVLADKVIEQAGGEDAITWQNGEDTDMTYYEYEDTPFVPYQTVGALLLGLTETEANLLFDGSVSRQEVMASLELLVAGEPIATTITPKKYDELLAEGNYRATRSARAVYDDDNWHITHYQVLVSTLEPKKA